MTRGVLLMAYGAPGAPEDIAPFYTDIRRGRPPTPELLAELVGRYDAIGGSSPLLSITRRQAAALQARLGAGYQVHIGMRHWTPWIRDAVADMARAGITEAVAVVLAPHYSRMSIGQYMARLDEALATLAPTAIHFRKVEHWHLQPHYLAALAARCRTALKKFEAPGTTAPPHVVFTAHSLPEKIREWNDPYPGQLQETAQQLAARLNLTKWSVGYQSAGRTPEPWLGPDLLTVISQLAAAGEKNLLVCVIGFVTDHLEVLYDIDLEAKPFAAKHGMRLERIEMLNDDPQLAEALAEVVEAASVA